jgi:hypothetical protein
MKPRFCLFLLTCLLAATAGARAQIGGTERDSSQDPFRIIIVPDTQYLPTNVFTEEMRWIETNRTAAPPILAMLHMGDVVDAPTVVQWGAKDPGIELLTNVPFLFCPGNHDYDPPIAARNLTTYNAHIPRSLYTRKPWWNGSFCARTGSENCYLTLTNGRTKLLLLSLEFGPRTNVLLWASNTAAAHPDHLTAIITHNYLMPSSLRNTTNDAYNPHVAYGMSDATDGEEMWRMVKDIPNLRFIWSGHQIGQPPVAHSIDVGTHGNWVSQVLCDWQEQIGLSELMVLTFQPASAEVLVESFNTSNGRYERDPQYEFTLPMNGSGKLPEPEAPPVVTTNAPASINILDQPPYNIPFPATPGATNEVER